MELHIASSDSCTGCLISSLPWWDNNLLSGKRVILSMVHSQWHGHFTHTHTHTHTDTHKHTSTHTMCRGGTHSIALMIKQMQDANKKHLSIVVKGTSKLHCYFNQCFLRLVNYQAIKTAADNVTSFLQPHYPYHLITHVGEGQWM